MRWVDVDEVVVVVVAVVVLVVGGIVVVVPISISRILSLIESLLFPLLLVKKLFREFIEKAGGSL